MRMYAAPKLWACLRSGSAAGLVDGRRISVRSGRTRVWPRCPSSLRFSIVSRSNKNILNEAHRTHHNASKQDCACLPRIGSRHYFPEFLSNVCSLGERPGACHSFLSPLFLYFFTAAFLRAAHKEESSAELAVDHVPVAGRSLHSLRSCLMDVIAFLYNGIQCDTSRKYCPSLGRVGSLADPEAAAHPRVLARTDHYTAGNGPDHGDGLHSSPPIRCRGRTGALHGRLLRRLLSVHGEESYALRSGQSHLAGGHWGELLTLSIEYRP